MFAAMINTDYAKKEIFQKNFMRSWRRLLKSHAETEHIKHFNKCDFSRIAQHLEEQARPPRTYPRPVPHLPPPSRSRGACPALTPLSRT